ncbi:MarR family winged helix-turn-helix transcriptional regulator [Nocardia stercoris]|uniref:MarR family transcriptional regulator n=1 Tax=Nocardia stercoris TaxID=2483361 RepID=A0A3M2L6X1_9NOCA|nr:MarR family transcriptional regulator [Nocardia stercoris]RMI33381.1 MarR family transcriptional regulator [Nocardia stercoris]
MSTAAGTPSTDPPESLVYLLKHAHLRLNELVAAELAEHPVSGRELAVLTVVAGNEPISQQQAAARLGVDRTTMVALLDELERKQLLSRHPNPADRRVNIVEMTPRGETVRAEARAAADRAEGRFLAALEPDTAAGLKRALRTVLRG